MAGEGGSDRPWPEVPRELAEHMRPHLIAGISQGKLTRLPEVSIHLRFRPFVEDTMETVVANDPTPPRRLLCHPETTATLADISLARQQPILLAIGPEGGWVPFEVELMLARGFEPFTLGPWVLRVETAVAVALGQVNLMTAAGSE